MDSFRMRYGTVQHAENKIMSLRFINGDPSEVVAVKGVCFVGDRLAVNLCDDFDFDQKVMFSAVKDYSSELPDVWKALCVWTTHKPSRSFGIEDWNLIVEKLYTDTRIIKNVLIGRVAVSERNLFVERNAVSEKKLFVESNAVSEKNIFVERKILRHICERISDDLFNCDHNLRGLFTSDKDLQYVRNVYGSLSNYVGNHSRIFKVSPMNYIFLKSKNYIDDYLQNELPVKLLNEKKIHQHKDEDEEKCEDEDEGEEEYKVEEKEKSWSRVKIKHGCREKEKSDEIESMRSKIYLSSSTDNYSEVKIIQLEKERHGFEEKGEQNYQKQKENVELESLRSKIYSSFTDIPSEVKIFRLEKEALTYFSSLLIRLREEGYVCCLSSKVLEKLLNSSPGLIKMYIIKMYSTLTNFIHFHHYAFPVGQYSTVLPASKQQLEEYLCNKLKYLVPDGPRSTHLYEVFANYHKLFANEIRRGDNCVDSCTTNFEVPSITTFASKENASTQTLSTGLILSMAQYHK